VFLALEAAEPIFSYKFMHKPIYIGLTYSSSTTKPSYPSSKPTYHVGHTLENNGKLLFYWGLVIVTLDPFWMETFFFNTSIFGQRCESELITEMAMGKIIDARYI
jgi:hypothetical protein